MNFICIILIHIVLFITLQMNILVKFPKKYSFYFIISLIISLIYWNFTKENSYIYMTFISNIVIILLYIFLKIYKLNNKKDIYIISDDKNIKENIVKMISQKLWTANNIKYVAEIPKQSKKMIVIIDKDHDIKKIVSNCYKNVYVRTSINNLYIDGNKAIYINDIRYFKINNMKLSKINSLLKRVLDIIISIFLIVVSLPISILTAILVGTTSKGGVIYSQERIGEKGKVFKIYKFRSMYKNSEEKGALLSKIDDPRITKVGKFIRQYKIDELPQLFNVLKGDMSLVGPRPERKQFVDEYSKKYELYELRHNVKPGLISVSHIYGDYYTNIETRTIYDLRYIYKYRYIKDLYYILKVIPTVLNIK